MTVYIYDTEFPDWKPSQPVSEWPHLFLVTFYAMMEKVAMHGSPAQRRQMRFCSLQLHKEAGGDPSLVDDIRRTRKEWRPKRPKRRGEAGNGNYA